MVFSNQPVAKKKRLCHALFFEIFENLSWFQGGEEKDIGVGVRIVWTQPEPAVMVFNSRPSNSTFYCKVIY